MITDELDIEIPAVATPDTPAPEELTRFSALEPHCRVNLNGVLCCGRTQARPRGDITEIVLSSLINLVRQVVNWTDTLDSGVQYLGDYRFLVLDFRTLLGIEAFVQIWSEPFCDLIIEIGLGSRQDVAQQSFDKGIRAHLLDRGF